MIDRGRLTAIYARERADFVARHPRSAAAYRRSDHLFGPVPTTWMNKIAGDFPIYLEHARGNRVWDIDGFEYVDFVARQHRRHGGPLARGDRGRHTAPDRGPG